MRSAIQVNYLKGLKLLSTVVNHFLMANRWLCSWIAFQFGSFTAISVMLYLHQFSLSLWIGTGAFGLFMSSVFPTTLALAEYYIDVTGKAVANQLKSDFAFFETSGRLSQVALFVNRLFTLSIKREIRQFYVVVLKWPQRNLQKAWCTCRVVVGCFASLNLLLFWRQFSSPSPSRQKSPLIKWLITMGTTLYVSSYQMSNYLVIPSTQDSDWSRKSHVLNVPKQWFQSKSIR